MVQRLRGMGRLRTLAVAVLVSSIVSAGIIPFLAHADARSDYLVRLLRTSDAFRVRRLGGGSGSGPIGRVMVGAPYTSFPGEGGRASSGSGRTSSGTRR